MNKRSKNTTTSKLIEVLARELNTKSTQEDVLKKIDELVSIEQGYNALVERAGKLEQLVSNLTRVVQNPEFNRRNFDLYIDD